MASKLLVNAVEKHADIVDVVLATYQVRRWLDADYGRTIIDGADVKT